MSRVVTLAALLTLALPRFGSAQAPTLADWRRQYLAVKRVGAEFTRVDSARRSARVSAVRFDTLHAGALTVVTAAQRLRDTRAAADSAWRILTRFFGDRAAAVAQTPVLVFYQDQADSEYPAGLFDGLSWQVPPDADLGYIASALVTLVEPLVTKQADQPLREWGLNAPTLASARAALVYEELATAPWRVVRECYQGRLASCRFALGISGQDPVMEWFDATDRRHYVSRIQIFSTLAPSGVFDHCSRDGDDASCVRLMRLQPGWQIVTPPLSVHARQLLLSLAIEHGGGGAFGRLVATTGQPLDARFAAAAGVPIDSLVSEWRSRVIAAHPKTVAADTRAAWAAVFWGIALSFVALQSTRWR